MDTGTLLAVISIVIGVLGFFIAKKVSKSKRLQKNKVIVKSKGDVTARDIVGGDKIIHGNDTKPR